MHRCLVVLLPLLPSLFLFKIKRRILLYFIDFGTIRKWFIMIVPNNGEIWTVCADNKSAWGLVAWPGRDDLFADVSGAVLFSSIFRISLPNWRRSLAETPFRCTYDGPCFMRLGVWQQSLSANLLSYPLRPRNTRAWGTNCVPNTFKWDRTDPNKRHSTTSPCSPRSRSNVN